MEQHNKLVAAIACSTVAITAYHILTKHHGIQNTWHTRDGVSQAWDIGKLKRAFRRQAKHKRQKTAATFDWAQSLEEVLIEVLVPACTTSKDVLVTFGSQRLLVIVGQHPVIDGQLSQPIQPSNSDWRLEGRDSRRILSITLCKCPPLGTGKRSAIWDSLLLTSDDNYVATADQAVQS